MPRYVVKVKGYLQLVYDEEDPKIAQGRAKQEILRSLGNLFIAESYEVNPEVGPA